MSLLNRQLYDTSTEAVTPFHLLKKITESKPKDFMISTFNEHCFCIGKQSGSDESFIWPPPTITILLTYAATKPGMLVSARTNYT